MSITRDRGTSKLGLLSPFATEIACRSRVGAIAGIRPLHPIVYNIFTNVAMYVFLSLIILSI